MSDNVDLLRLADHFAPTDIEWRIGQSGKKQDGTVWAKAFAYITNRAIQERLDAVVGPGNWRNEEPRIVHLPGPGGEALTAFLCGLSIRVNGEWVTKWDGAEPSDMEPVKGGLSGAMKRAAVQWGIGRYLYELPEGWAKVSEKGTHYAQTKDKTSFRWDAPDLPKWALPQGEPEGNGAARGDSAPAAGISTGGATQPLPATERPNAAVLPTVKRVEFYRRLADSAVFSAEERQRALQWLETKATRQTIKDQIDWLKRQVETRKNPAHAQAASIRDAFDTAAQPDFSKMPPALDEPPMPEDAPW